MRWLLLLALLAPVATAQAFEGALEDRTGDVATRDGRRVDRPGIDIVGFTSRVEDGLVEQRVAMAGAPRTPPEGIVVRSWFRHSVEGSFHVVDLEVKADEAGTETFRAFTREGEHGNVSPIEAAHRVEGNERVFTFDASVARDAECFAALIYAFYPRDGPDAYDEAGGAGAVPCRTTLEPAGPPPVAVAPSVRMQGTTEPRVEPPGTRTPPVGAPALIAVVVLAAAAFAFRRRG